MPDLLYFTVWHYPKLFASYNNCLGLANLKMIKMKQKSNILEEISVKA
jgi:hypothetical protein